MTLFNYKVGVLTISDSCSKGDKPDKSGERIIEILRENGVNEIVYRVVPDEISDITDTLLEWIDREGIDLVITTGGTGLYPRDVTPEAVRPLLDREIPGISEAIRIKGLEETPNAMLSRGVSGIRKGSLVVTLPGSPKAVESAMKLILPVIPHALKKIKGDDTPCHIEA